ncbi:hypothetical protein [Anabaena sp. UHCC 0204]|uniref:hypothetical protein n=1 Tax=Anabaena sp. UHCC 0204 TaxID=2590009 RepID=UPI001446BE4D|nr:hypothetical protein [Anabaena sp. UHCC 0204]MTJ09336.1 hypothetical protein [Anabaena sp. UHCC 0204]
MSIIEIETDLSRTQLSKFKKLFTLMKLINGKTYFPTSEMHGVLLTQSKQNAINIIQSHLKFIQQYVLNIDDSLYIKHIGIDVLLDTLGEENPKKKIQYLAARAYISAFLANNSDVFKDSMLRGIELDKEQIQAMQYVKKNSKHCTLTLKRFQKGIKCHIHHIEGVSERPDLATDVKNLLPLCEDVHTEYHQWVISNQKSVTRATLKHFAKEKKYETNW